MKKYIFIFFILIFTSPLIPFQRGKLVAQVPYRIRLSDSTYTAQLIGISGKRTVSDTVTGTWSSTYKLHEFDVEHTGPYQLYVDPAGGTNYSLVSSWGKSNGKAIAGYDWVDFWQSINSLSQLMSIGIGDTSISTVAYKDSSVTMPKLSTTVHAAMGAYGAGTYPPDDVELEFIINGSDTTISIKDSWLIGFRSEVGDSVTKARTWANAQTFTAINNITQAADYSAASYGNLQEAIDSVVSKNYKYLYLPRGVYYIDTTITITTDSLKLIGDEGLSIIKLSNAANVDQMFMLDSCSYVTIEGITFDNNESNQSGGELRCIQTQNSVTNLMIRNCNFEGNGRAAASGSYGIWLHECYDSTVDNIFVDGWTNHDFLRLSWADNIFIRNSIFKNLSTTAIALSSEVENTIISTNLFDSIGDSSLSRGHAVTSNTSQNSDETLWPEKIVITGNIADGCFGDVIHVEQGFRFVISNNIIRSYFVTAADSVGDTGISCSAEQSVIIGNHVSGNASPGITLFNNPKYATSFNMIVLGNSIFDNGIHTVASSQKNGIWLDDVQRCIVAANLAVDNFDTQNYGVYSSGTSKYNVVVNNILALNQIRPLHFTNDSLDNIILGNAEWLDGAISPEETRMSSFFQQEDIDARNFGGHKIAFTFYYDNAGDSISTPLQIETAGGLSKAYRLPTAGSVLSICVATTEAQSAGSLTTEVYLNNVATGLSATIDGSGITAKTTSQAKDVDAFAGEVAIAVKITTSDDWAPETADIYVTVIVEM